MSQTPRASSPPSASGNARAAGQIRVPGQQQVARDAGPHQADHSAVAVIRVHTGAAGLHQRRTQSGERGQIEFGLGIVAAGRRRAHARRRQHPVGTDDLAGLVGANYQVVAVLVETVDVKASAGVTVRDVQRRAEFIGEDLIAEPLGGRHLGGVRGQQ